MLGSLATVNAAELCLTGIRRRGKLAEIVAAPDNTRDSILFQERERGKGREKIELSCKRVKCYWWIVYVMRMR